MKIADCKRGTRVRFMSGSKTFTGTVQSAVDTSHGWATVVVGVVDEAYWAQLDQSWRGHGLVQVSVYDIEPVEAE